MPIPARPFAKSWRNFLPNELPGGDILPDLLVLHDLEPRAAALNMALDEALLQTVTQPVLRFYRWRRPALSFGYFGRFADVAAEASARELVRRWTGGGIVLHGADLTYSIILPRHRLPSASTSPAVVSKISWRHPSSACRKTRCGAGRQECPENVGGLLCQCRHRGCLARRAGKSLARRNGERAQGYCIKAAFRARNCLPTLLTHWPRRYAKTFRSQNWSIRPWRLRKKFRKKNTAPSSGSADAKSGVATAPSLEKRRPKSIKRIKRNEQENFTQSNERAGLADPSR